MTSIATDFNEETEMVRLTNKWLQKKDNGMYTINYALTRHPDLAEFFITCVKHFTGGGKPMSWAYMNTMQDLYQDQTDFF